MAKRLAIVATVAAVVLALVVTHLWTRVGREAAIARAETEARMLREQRDSILTVVARNDSLQRELGTMRTSLEAEADRLRDVVDSLEVERAETQLTVRRLRRAEDLQAQLRTTFPEMADSDWGTTEVFNEEEEVGVEYLMVPLWFSETFLIDHKNSIAYEAQRDTLRSLTELQGRISELQDSVIALEQQSRTAYQTGYDSAFSLYQALNREHIDLLRQPRLSLGVPGGVATTLASFGVGLLIGVTAK